MYNLQENELNVAGNSSETHKLEDKVWVQRHYIVKQIGIVMDDLSCVWEDIIAWIRTCM